MKDIVKVCREACCSDYLPTPCQVGIDAADEIERLRELLLQWSLYEGSRELRAETLAAIGRLPDTSTAVRPGD